VKRFLLGIAILLWSGFIVTVFYITQKPNISALMGLADTIWTLLVAALLLFNAYGMGKRVLSALGMRPIDGIERFLLGVGCGLGALGLLGLGISAIQMAKVPILATFQIGLALFFILSNDIKNLREDIKVLKANLHLSFNQYGLPAKLAILLPFAFSFLLTLVPPFEAFDALLYHLAQPASILQNGGIHALDNVPFWFPNITENVYLWALAFGSERAPQIIHLAWGTLAALLLWHWSTKTWNAAIGGKVLLLITAIPSLAMLASWAYADMALVYYAVASLYTLTSYRISKTLSLLMVTGFLAGLSMGVKYTSFVLPLTCGLILLFRRPFIQSFKEATQFSVAALLIALPWYVRNTVFMGNPFYPFIFGGQYWDDFLSKWYAGAGTGIGWNALQIFMLPLNTLLGNKDATFFDGRLGPLFLVLTPCTLWILLSRTPRDSAQKLSLVSISFFVALSFAAWTLGVINSAALWQARLLFPAIMAFSIPTALGWDAIQEADTSSLRISFIVNVLITIVITLTVFENGVFTLQRNPLAVIFGAQSREGYIKRVASSYAELIQNMDKLPANASVYSLFEPRSYGLPRSIQPDAIVSNFAHDLYLYKSPGEIINTWKREGYTHILVYERGRQFILESNTEYLKPGLGDALTETLSRLQLVNQTPDQIYSIYKIP